MRNWRVRSSYGRQSSRKACWGLLVVTLTAIATFNFYAYNYRKALRAASDKNIIKRAPNEPSEALAKQVHPAVTSIVSATSAPPGTTGGVNVTPTAGGNKLTEPGTPLYIQKSLPLGRDQPLVIRVRASTSPANADGAAVHYDADRLGWPNEGDEHVSTVHNFPCSLTEVDQFPGLGAAFGGAYSGGSNRLLGQQQEKAWSTSGPCVISCTAKSDAQKSHVEVEQKEGDRGSSPEGSSHCPRALQACELYQECTHVLLPPLPNEQQEQGSPQEDFALLMHAPSVDGSMAAVEAAAAGETDSRPKWGRLNKGFTLEARPRTYYIVSFGGSGSKMLGGWLSERGKSMVREVYHIHDPVPAETLFAKETRKRVSPGRVGRGRDFRGYDFPEGEFPRAGSIVEDVDSYRVVLIFKDPAEALVSRYFYNHCKNLRGADCGGSEKAFPSLERYAEESGDRLHMESFYDNYCNPSTVHGSRNYPVICLNYHKMWDNKQALVASLGLPAEEASKMPTRTETVRNDQTSARRGEPFTLAVRERLRVKHASLSAKVFNSPAVAIV